jgi:argininosuccinate synthase
MQAKYAELVYNGFWFTAERESMQVYFDHVGQSVTGTARMKLFKGNCLVAGRKSPVSLYDPQLVTFEKETVYDQADAGGFIKLNALRARVRARLQKD